MIERRVQSPWWQMWSGMRAYGAAISVIWGLSATTVLVVLAVAVGGLWLHVVFGSAAVLEVAASTAMFVFLLRHNANHRFDVR